MKYFFSIFVCTGCISVLANTITNLVTVYDLLGRVMSVTTPWGCTSNSYDGASSRMMRSVLHSGDLNISTEYIYDPLGQQVGTLKNGVMNDSRTAYKNISGTVWRVQRETVSDTTGVTNSVQVSALQMNGLSNALRHREIHVSADIITTESKTHYDPATEILTEVVESNVKLPIFNFSKYGLLLKSITCDGEVCYKYDEFGRRVETLFRKDENEEFTTLNRTYYNTYSDITRKDTFVNNTNFVSDTYVYDMLGNLTEHTNALGLVVFSSYDPFGRIISIDGSSIPIRCSYDPYGNRTTLATTPDGITWNVTRWEYDVTHSRILSKIIADGSRYIFTYTPDGLPLSTTNPSGKAKQKQYDSNRQLSAIRYSDPNKWIDFSRNVFGMSTNIVDSQGVKDTNVFGRNSKLLSETRLYNGVTNTLDYYVDTFNRTTCIVHRVNGNVHFKKSYVYDENNRIGSVEFATPANGLISCAYTNNAGYTLGTSIRGNSGNILLQQQLTRDQFRQQLVLRCKTNTGEGNVISDLNYIYDELGRPISRNGDAFYSYDVKGQIANFTDGTNSISYVWNEAGSPLSETINGNSRTFLVNNLNQCVGINSDTMSCSIPRHPDGGVLSFGDWSYTYDEENRLSCAVLDRTDDSSIRLTSFYDYRNRRIRRDMETRSTTGDDWSMVERRSYVYCEDNLVEECVITYNGMSTNLVLIQYFWGVDASGSSNGAGGVGGLIAVSQNGTIYLPVYDSVGNIIKYLDVNGNVCANYEYDAFGKIVRSQGPLTNLFRFRFSTKYYETETGLYDFGYRFLNPEILQWMTPDPSGESGGVNLYAFCENASTYSYDPNGQVKIPFLTNQAKQAWENVIRDVLDQRGWRVAAFLMRHSLKESPDDLHFEEGHFVSQAIKKSPEYNKLIKSLIAKQSEVFKEYNISLPLIFPTGDLFAAIHRATIHISGSICKSATGTKTDLSILVSDDYDFHFLVSDYYKLSVNGILGTIANNMAWSDQFFDVITTYSWKSEFKDKR